MPSTVTHISWAVTEINECESQPCYPFGNCTDLVDDYNCTCLPGFYSDNSSNQICHDVDECEQFLESNENSVCYNGGTCQDDINRFFCVDCIRGQDKYFTDNRCQNSTYAFPLINEITRRTGPVAGGTLVTFVGTGLDITPVIGAYFNDSEGELPELMGHLLSGSVQSSNSFVVVTSKANDSYTGRNLTIVVLFNGGVLFALQDSVTFQYVGNPIITDIQPREIPICGGVRLTVKGNNLDIVSTAIMLLTLETKYPDGRVTRNSTNELCNSLETNSTQMICQLPVYDLPEEVQHALVEASINSSTDGGRNKRHALRHLSNLHSAEINSTNGLHLSTLSHLISSSTDLRRKERHLHRTRRNATASYSAGNSSVKLYVGFLLDNYPKYENLTKVLPNVTIKMTLQLPRIGLNGARDYSDDPLPIKGQRMTSGCSKDDYSVFVGNGTCVVVTLTDNQLLCILPIEKPLNADNANALLCADDHLPVIVKVSNSSYHAWCIHYGPPQPPWVIWTCVGAGLLLLIISLGVTIAVAVRLQRNRKRRLRGPSVNDRDNRRQDGVGRIAKRRQRHIRDLGGHITTASEEGVDWNLAPFGGPLSGQNSYTSRILSGQNSYASRIDGISDMHSASTGRHTIDHLDGSGRARFEYDRRIGSLNSGISAATGRYNTNLRTISENGLINQDEQALSHVGGASSSKAPHFVNKPFGYLVRPGQRIRYTTPAPSETPEENEDAEREQSDRRHSTVGSQNWYFGNPFGRLGRPFERVDHERTTEPMRKAIKDHQMRTSQGNNSGGIMVDQRFKNEGEINRSTTPEPDYDARNVDIDRNEISGDYSRTMESGLNSVISHALVNYAVGPSSGPPGSRTSDMGVSRDISNDGPGNN